MLISFKSSDIFPNIEASLRDAMRFEDGSVVIRLEEPFGRISIHITAEEATLIRQMTSYNSDGSAAAPEPPAKPTVRGMTFEDWLRAAKIAEGTPQLRDCWINGINPKGFLP